MRLAYITSFLAVFFALSGPGAAFDIEAQKHFAAAPQNGQLNILSTADLNVFEPIILAFQQSNPTISVVYTVASSTEVMQAILLENASFDLVISSAMDLQTKLTNDGFAQTYQSDATRALPDWANWRDQLFAFTQEPAVLVISKHSFREFAVPSTREDLINLLREHPERFEGRIGTYDVRISGLGYLFATQESRNTDSFWRLIEMMGRLNTQLYCCSGDMINDVIDGKLAFAYNVLGSYAASRIHDADGVEIIQFNDFLSVMLRTALIPKTASHPTEAGRMIDFLTTQTGDPDLTSQTGLPPVAIGPQAASNTLRPIRLGPGLLVFLDKLKKEKFQRNWQNSIVQN